MDDETVCLLVLVWYHHGRTSTNHTWYGGTIPENGKNQNRGTLFFLRPPTTDTRQPQINRQPTAYSRL